MTREVFPPAVPRPRLALLFASILLAGALAGCADRLRGTGTLRLEFLLSGDAEFEFRGGKWENRMNQIQRGVLPVFAVVVKRGDAEPVIPTKELPGIYEVTTIAGTPVVLSEEKVVKGLISSVAVTIFPFNVTLLNGTIKTVNTSMASFPPTPYSFKHNATVELAGETTFRVAFMITEGKVLGRPKEFFLMARGDLSGQV